MSDGDNIDNFNVDSLLNSLFPGAESSRSLRGLFNDRLKVLNINTTAVLELLSIESRGLNGILDGSQKRVDFTTLFKLSDFLQISREETVQLFLASLERNFPDNIPVSPEKIKFIQENFDLAVLKKAGFIDNISDYAHIEKKICSLFGYKSVLEYQQNLNEVAFSAGKTIPKNNLTRRMWVAIAKQMFTELDNPYPYNRQALIDYFPQIRWHSTNVDLGLLTVIREIAKAGVSILYVPSLQTLHLRGATFAVNGKPCIAITDYRGFYPTLWFALIHELFHVIFDWDDILKGNYHLSVDDSEDSTVVAKEQEADSFAREYLFSKEKTMNARAHMNNPNEIAKIAINNHVHPSFIYVFNASDMAGKTSWILANQHNPKIEKLLKRLGDFSWHNIKPIDQLVKNFQTTLNK